MKIYWRAHILFQWVLTSVTIVLFKTFKVCGKIYKEKKIRFVLNVLRLITKSSKNAEKGFLSIVNEYFFVTFGGLFQDMRLYPYLYDNLF